MSALRPKILIIDHDPRIHRYLRTLMGGAGYEVLGVFEGRQALEIFAADPPDGVILDLDLRDMRGEDLLEEICRTHPGPVLVLSSRTRDIEKINALDLGADDFVCKPFGAGELLARIRVSFRRRLKARGVDPAPVAKGLKVDLVRRAVVFEGAPLALTEPQYAVLARLAAAGGRAVTPHDLAAEALAEDRVSALRTVRLLIAQLRTRIERSPGVPKIITTERGVGYMLDAT